MQKIQQSLSPTILTLSPLMILLKLLQKINFTLIILYCIVALNSFSINAQQDSLNKKNDSLNTSIIKAFNKKLATIDIQRINDSIKKAIIFKFR